MNITKTCNGGISMINNEQDIIVSKKQTWAISLIKKRKLLIKHQTTLLQISHF